ncbi:hypothetical protein [Microcoleus sp. OTE_8_concoct_300]|uniref:hypothetical protein n=1 Tax=Microcoleus sp. OTE_8_concoct_300 TaxID=2964710 RepID=UPI00403F10A3
MPLTLPELGILTAIASEVFAVTDCNPSPCLSSTTITFPVFVGHTYLYSWVVTSTGKLAD